jgi:hypothetical protein
MKAIPDQVIITELSFQGILFPLLTLGKKETEV